MMVTRRMPDVGRECHQDIIWNRVTGGVKRAGMFIQRPRPGYCYPDIMKECIRSFRKPGAARRGKMPAPENRRPHRRRPRSRNGVRSPPAAAAARSGAARRGARAGGSRASVHDHELASATHLEVEHLDDERRGGPEEAAPRLEHHLDPGTAPRELAEDRFGVVPESRGAGGHERGFCPGHPGGEPSGDIVPKEGTHSSVSRRTWTPICSPLRRQVVVTVLPSGNPTSRRSLAATWALPTHPSFVLRFVAVCRDFDSKMNGCPL